MTARNPRAAFSFVGKLAATALLAALADYLFYRADGIGATIGVFAIGWSVTMLVALPQVRRRRAALVAMGAALFFGALLVDNPGVLGWALFWAAISSAALLRRRRFDDALRLAERLVLQLGAGLIQPLADIRRLWRSRPTGGNFSIKGSLSVVALPAIGGMLFFTLFTIANPVIANQFTQVDLHDPSSAVLHAMFWCLVAIAVWPSLRPHPFATGTALREATLEGLVPKVPAVSIALSLLTFNAVFALQNILDIAFLWSGALLPGKLTLADYAHRGAGMLMVTALLAGLFVVVVLRPGSETARRPAIRWLVALWIAQTILLVASSILRTLDYIASYSLTELRIWALGCMALVGVGLALVCWRLLRGKSAAWVINANALAAVLLLAGLATIDPGEVSAWWNVRHARQVGGKGVEIDLCYLDRLGAAAVLPLIELEGKVQRQPLLLDRVRAVRSKAMTNLVYAQSDRFGWTWRNARRLAVAQALLGPNPPKPMDPDFGCECDGSGCE